MNIKDLFKKCDYKFSNFKEIQGIGEYMGFVRMKFRNHWDNIWFGREYDTQIPKRAGCMLNNLLSDIQNNWQNGCDMQFELDIQKYDAYWSENGKRHLLEISDNGINYIFLIDATYGNCDYPIRIYIYEE